MIRGGIEERVGRTLELASGLLERHARTPGTAPASLRLRALLEVQRFAFESARKITVPQLRQQRLFVIPIATLQAAAADLAVAAEAAGTRHLALSNSVKPVPALELASVGSSRDREKRSAVSKLAALFTRSPANLPAPEPQESPLLADLAKEVRQTRVVYTYAAGRVGIVEKGVMLRQQPDTILDSEPPKVQEVAKALAKLFALQPGTLQRSQIAIHQSTDLRRELFLADQALSQGSVHPRAPGELRGKTIPVRNFPRTFAKDPILQKLFPLETAEKGGFIANA